MRDASTAARQAQDPETVLPYDPDEWERRLAEARKRREAVLRQKAGAASPAPQDTTPVKPADTDTRTRAMVPDPPRPSDPTPNDWQHRLAAARGLAPPEDRAPVNAARQSRTGHGVVPAAAGGPVTAARPETSSPPLPARRRPDPAPTGAAATSAAAWYPAAPRRPGWSGVGLAALAGLAAGVALAVAVQVPTPLALPVMPDTAVPVAASLPGGFAPVAVAGDVLGRRPTETAGVGLALSLNGGQPPVAGPLPDEPHQQTVAPAPASLAPDDIPAVIPAARPTPSARPEPDAGPIPQPAPPLPAAVFVVVHVPPALAQDGGDALLSDSRAAGWPIVPVAFTVSRSHLRVYHNGDRAAAAELGARLDLPVRDFVGTVPAPQGLIEVWIAGGPVDAG